MARLFNGTTDKIDCGTNALLVPTTGLVTYAGWVKPNTPTAYDAPFGSYPPGVGGGLGIFVKSDGKIAIYPAGGLCYDGTGTATLSNGVWYHLAVSFDNNFVQNGIGYVNGVQDGTGGGNALTTQPFLIGTSANGGAPFHGTVADVGVWNVRLTAVEIAALAQGARPNKVRSASLQGYWPLDGIASPEPDLSGNVFNGTVTGTTAVAGPPIAMFTPRWPSNVEPSAAASFIPAWGARGSNLPVLGTGNY